MAETFDLRLQDVQELQRRGWDMQSEHVELDPVPASDVLPAGPKVDVLLVELVEMA